MELFAKVAHERGAAVLVATHDHRSVDVLIAHSRWKMASLSPNVTFLLPEKACSPNEEHK
jgi:ABC-type lipoprotein export system ATPase subunit